MKTTTHEKHTPEPWRHGGGGHIRPMGGGLLASAIGQGDADIPNAERIIACVNGCKNIHDPETTVPRLVAALNTFLDLPHTKPRDQRFAERQSSGTAGAKGDSMSTQTAATPAVHQQRLVHRSGHEYEPWLEYPSEARKKAYADAGVRTIQRGATLYVHVWDTEEAAKVDSANAEINGGKVAPDSTKI